jgi:hypothetical protein
MDDLEPAFDPETRQQLATYGSIVTSVAVIGMAIVEPSLLTIAAAVLSPIALYGGLVGLRRG